MATSPERLKIGCAKTKIILVCRVRSAHHAEEKVFAKVIGPISLQMQAGDESWIGILARWLPFDELLVVLRNHIRRAAPYDRHDDVPAQNSAKPRFAGYWSVLPHKLQRFSENQQE